MNDVSQLDYSMIVDAIRCGVRKVKGVTTASGDVSQVTDAWANQDPDQQYLALDSLDFLELVIFLEERFGWTIPEDQIDSEVWRTVGDMASAIMALENDTHSEP